MPGKSGVKPSSIALLVGVVMLLSGMIATRLLISPIGNLLSESGFLRRNYAGKNIPSGAGITFPLASAFPLVVASFFIKSTASLWLIILFGMALIGFFDDAAGDRSIGGFTGHMKALMALKPTTGSIKALIGGALSLYAGFGMHGLSFTAFVSGLLIALTTNTVNLLDVRPGRALKGYFILALIGTTGIIMLRTETAFYHLALGAAPIGVAIAIWNFDMKGQVMLGDAGANVLGASAGLLLVLLPLLSQVALVVMLIILQILSEKVSFSAVIESVPVLNKIDEWGRRD